jgi:hypothetical protein
MDPRSNANWKALFSKIKFNTLGKATIPVSKKSHKARKLDFTKVGYGTVIKPKPTGSKVNGSKQNPRPSKGKGIQLNGNANISGFNKPPQRGGGTEDWENFEWWGKDLDDDDNEKWEQSEEWIPDGW